VTGYSGHSLGRSIDVPTHPVIERLKELTGAETSRGALLHWRVDLWFDEAARQLRCGYMQPGGNLYVGAIDQEWLVLNHGAPWRNPWRSPSMPRSECPEYMTGAPMLPPAPRESLFTEAEKNPYR
jgi:hypothetical protein